MPWFVDFTSMPQILCVEHDYISAWSKIVTKESISSEEKSTEEGDGGD